VGEGEETQRVRAGVSSRQASLAHSFMCLSASTAQLRALTEGLQANAHYVYSEAAPAHARAGLSDAQLAAFPSLYAPPDQAPQQQGPEAAAQAAYPRIVELTTLGGLLLSSHLPEHTSQSVMQHQSQQVHLAQMHACALCCGAYCEAFQQKRICAHAPAAQASASSCSPTAPRWRART
jgi:hypothetical protein